MKRQGYIFSVCLLVGMSSAFGDVGDVWNIGDDWDGSETLPSVFSFSQMNHFTSTQASPPLPVTTYIANWHSAHLGTLAGGTVEQPAFVPAAGGTEPGFAIAVNDNPMNMDLLAGDMVMHGQGSIDWTSPIDGLIKVDTTAWGLGSIGGGGGHDLYILEDGIFNGDDSDHFIGNFSNGNSSRLLPLSGTATFDVTDGQVVRVWARSGSATFWGISANIEQVEVVLPDPNCINPPLADFNGDCWIDSLDLLIFVNGWLDCGLDLQDQCFIKEE